MTLNKRKHYLISGVGRSGTTFLVRLLTHLGLETGFTKEQCDTLINPISKAGLEFDLRSQCCPYIVKNPWFCLYANEVLQDESIMLDHVLIPIRDLHSAAESRRRVAREGEEAGGLWLTESQKVGDQEIILGQNLYSLCFWLTKYQVPFSFVLFPRLAEDANYLYAALGNLVKDIPFQDFNDIFNLVRKSEWIGNFTSQ
jgi:hypothetical protein